MPTADWFAPIKDIFCQFFILSSIEVFADDSTNCFSVPNSISTGSYSVADSDSGSGTFLTPGTGIRDGEKIRIRNPG
jgi:hypothetical protein